MASEKPKTGPRTEPIKSLGTSRLAGTAFAVALGVKTAITALTGCGSEESKNNKPKVEQNQKKITMPESGYLYSQGIAPLSQPEIEKPSGMGRLSTGEKIYTFILNDECYFTTAPDMESAWNQDPTDATPVSLESWNLGGPALGVPTCGVGIDDDIIYYTTTTDGILEMDVALASGTLQTSNVRSMTGSVPAEELVVVDDGTYQLIIGSANLVKPFDLTTHTLGPSTGISDFCGAAHTSGEPGAIWTMARFDDYDGEVSCRPTRDSSLAPSVDFIPEMGTDATGLTADIRNLRSEGDTVIAEVRRRNPADWNGPLLPSEIEIFKYIPCGDAFCDSTHGENVERCPADCSTGPVCGDGNLDAGEVCDDNNTVDGDGCSADCMSDETCGNNITDAVTGEVCDDGNNVDGDGCSANCMSDETCGNLICDTNEDYNTCQVDCEGECGDGVCDPTETNATCPTDCPPEPCGDGVCDTLNENYDTCPQDCTGECGDGVCDPTETKATCQEDCPNDPECQVFIDDGRITFVPDQGDCEMSECTETALKEEFVIFGATCRFDIDYGDPNPVEFSLYSTDVTPSGGTVRIDFIDSSKHERFGGGVDVEDNGNHHGQIYVKNGHTVELVAEGTGYKTEDRLMPINGNAAYYAECRNGQISLYKDEELVATHTENGTELIDMGEDNPDPDAGVDAGVDGGGADAGTTPPGQPGCSEGCSASGGKMPASVPITLLLASIAAYMARRRKQQEEDVNDYYEKYEIEGRPEPAINAVQEPTSTIDTSYPELAVEYVCQNEPTPTTIMEGQRKKLELPERKKAELIEKFKYLYRRAMRK